MYRLSNSFVKDFCVLCAVVYLAVCLRCTHTRVCKLVVKERSVIEASPSLK